MIPGLLAQQQMPRGYAPLNPSLFNPDGTLKMDISAASPMQTSAIALPTFITEGTGRNQGPGEAPLGRGTAEYGINAGKNATADKTTTATTDWGEAAKSALMGINPAMAAIGTLAALAAGKNEPGMGLGTALRGLGQSLGLIGHDEQQSYGPGEASGFSSAPTPGDPTFGGGPAALGGDENSPSLGAGAGDGNAK